MVNSSFSLTEALNPRRSTSIIGLLLDMSVDLLTSIFLVERDGVNQAIVNQILDYVNSNDSATTSSDHINQMLMCYLPWFVTQTTDSRVPIDERLDQYSLKSLNLLQDKTWCSLFMRLFFPGESVSVLIMDSEHERKIIFQPTRVTRLWTIFVDLFPFGDVGYYLAKMTVDRVVTILQESSNKPTKLLGASLGGALIKNYLIMPALNRYAQQDESNVSAVVVNAPGTMTKEVETHQHIPLKIINQAGDLVSSLGYLPKRGRHVDYYLYNPYPKSPQGYSLMSHWVLGPITDSSPQNSFTNSRTHPWLTNCIVYLVRPTLFPIFLIYLTIRAVAYWLVFKPVKTVYDALCLPTRRKKSTQSPAPLPSDTLRDPANRCCYRADPGSPTNHSTNDPNPPNVR